MSTNVTKRWVIQHRCPNSVISHYREEWANSNVGVFLFPPFAHSGPWHGHPNSFEWKRTPGAVRLSTMLRHYENPGTATEEDRVVAHELLMEMVKWDSEGHEFRLIQRTTTVEERQDYTIRKTGTI